MGQMDRLALGRRGGRWEVCRVLGWWASEIRATGSTIEWWLFGIDKAGFADQKGEWRPVLF
jgi:hypothetical protein